MSRKNVIDLAEARNLAAFVKRCDEAAEAFPLWVLDADHQPVRATSAMQWAEFKTDFENTCRVGRDEIGELAVSTVFLGTDMGYGMSRRPILFETMIFGPGRSDVADRYASWDEAVAGHDRIVKELSRAA